MRTAGRLAAGIEILTEVLERHRPAAQALSDWGKAHRFAGSGDRAAIGNLVYDALRRRLSLAWQMQADTPRALALAAAIESFGLSGEQVAALADGSAHAPAALTDQEAAGLAGRLASEAPDNIRGDVPEWLAASFARAFAGRVAEEGEALARRAPVDLRVNPLKATRDKLIAALARHGAEPTPFSPLGVRIPAPAGPGRTPNVEAEAAHGKGWFEVQDEGSQIAALLAGAGPRQQVLDLCAGAGGKTLALAAGMQNTGQIYAYDRDRSQLRPIFERLRRAGVRNAQVLEAGDEAGLLALGPRFDVVVVDAPCTGSGVWRRRPDAKWRLKPRNLAERIEEQRAVLLLAHRLVRPGGRLVYVTCSVLPEENGDQVDWLREQAGELALEPTGEVWARTIGGSAPASADGCVQTLLLTPARHGTDGFFVACLQRAG